jgi:membrane-associated protease RseP (regulator of RpoE activity)
MGLVTALVEGTEAAVWQALRAGLPFAATLLAILGIHELGHYLAARWHGVRATLPYFIPMPVGGLGTLGAFISLRSPMKDRRTLFDIGLAGPIAGFAIALPLLIVGIWLSQPVPLHTPGLTLRAIGSSVLVDGLLGWLVKLPPGQTLALHPVFFAAWFGILITGINLLPIGQLDGGHVAYGLLGRNAHHVARGTLVLLLAAGFGLSRTWLLWALFVLFGGLHHPPPLNDISGVGWQRRFVGMLALLLFFLIITPDPFPQW